MNDLTVQRADGQMVVAAAPLAPLSVMAGALAAVRLRLLNGLEQAHGDRTAAVIAAAAFSSWARAKMQGSGRLQATWLLAGGLTPANVAEAIAASGATGVDVSSGVERARGIKDPAAIAAFIANAKAARA